MNKILISKPAFALKKVLCALLMALAIVPPASAYDFEADGFCFNVLSSKTAEVTYKSASASGYYGNLEIPSTVTYSGRTLTVTGIGEKAFIEGRNVPSSLKLKSVTIPASITNIGSNAFSSCTELAEIYSEIPNPANVTYGTSVFSTTIYANCKLMVPRATESAYRSTEPWSNFSFIIERDYDFEEGGFYYNYISGTHNVEVTRKTSNGNSYFGEVNIPSTVTHNGITYAVTRIGDSAFFFCSSLTKVTIPSSVTEIGDAVFVGCSNLASFKTPADAYSTRTLVINGELKGFAPYGVTDYKIPNTVTRIGKSVFAGCTNLTSIIIPEGVTHILNSAFANCTSLTSLVIPNTVTTISDAFYGCSNLQKLTLGNAISYLASRAFADCTSLTEIDAKMLDPNMVVCGDDIFPTSIYSTCTLFVPMDSRSAYQAAEPWKNFTNFDNLAYDFEADGLYFNILEGNNVEVTYKSPSHNSYVGTVNIPKTVTHNGITYTVTVIGDYAFSDCVGELTVNVPNTITEIGYGAFRNCPKFYVIDLPNSVRTINYGAFQNCSSLRYVMLGSALTVIDEKAFYACPNIEKVSVKLEIPVMMRCGANIFSPETYSNATLCVPKNSVTDYKTIAPWKNFTHQTTVNYDFESNGIYYKIIPNTQTVEVTFRDDIYNSYHDAVNIPSTVTSHGSPYTVVAIGAQALEKSYLVPSITIPSTVTRIDSAALHGCTHIETIIVPNSVTTIGDFAFYNCADMTSITLPDKLTSIGEGMLGLCESLTNVEIPSTVTSIGSMAFYKCARLTSATIPDAVTTIGQNAFYNCAGLTSVTVPNTVTTIGSYAFAYCTGLTDLTIGKNVTTFGSRAFFGCTSLQKVKSNIEWPSHNLSYGQNMFSTETYSNATLYVPKGSISDYQGWDPWRNFTNIVEATLIGDINNDGEIDAADISSLANKLLNGDTTLNDDVNGDGEVNAADNSTLTNIILGK